MPDRGIIMSVLDRPLENRILRRYVLPEERVVVATRRHWGALLEPATTAMVVLLLVASVSARVERSVGEPATLLWWVWLALVARLIWRLLEWRNEWFVATDKRLLMTYGLITHKVAMMPLRKVTDMNYGRSPFGRILGYGQFLLESAGQDQAMRKIDWVPDPDDTYRRICDTIFGPGGRDPEEDLVIAGDDPDDDGASRATRGSRRAEDDHPPRTRSGEDGLDDQGGLEDHDGFEDDLDMDEDQGWQVSHEEASGWTPASWYEIGTPANRPEETDEAEDIEDPDITGPLPRPSRPRR